MPKSAVHSTHKILRNNRHTCHTEMMMVHEKLLNRKREVAVPLSFKETVNIIWTVTPDVGLFLDTAKIYPIGLLRHSWTLITLSTSVDQCNINSNAFWVRWDSVVVIWEHFSLLYWFIFNYSSHWKSTYFLWNCVIGCLAPSELLTQEMNVNAVNNGVTMIVSVKKH